MAGFMDSFNKGFTTLNVKTSNLKESSRLRTAISARKAEIDQLMYAIGETVYANRANFRIEMIADMLDSAKAKHDEIDAFENELALLEEREKSILGGGATGPVAKLYCTQCGAPNSIGDKFCEKCGARLES